MYRSIVGYSGEGVNRKKKYREGRNPQGYNFSTMKLLIVLALLAVIIPVHGQEKRPQSKTNKNASSDIENTSAPADQVVVVNQENAKDQGNGAASHAQSYLSRLFSPENLPNIGLFFAGLVGICVAVRTLTKISEQTTAAKNSAETALHTANAFVHSERPWIYPQVALVDDLKYGEQGAQITLDITLNNVGNTPGVGIWIEPQLYVLSPAKPHPIEARNRLCNEITQRKPDLGYVVFPGVPFGQRYIINAVDTEIKSCNQTIFAQGPPDGPPCDFYCIAVIVAVAYRTALDDSARYYTGVIYDLQRVDRTKPIPEFGLRIGQNVPLGHLQFTMSPVGGMVAK
jgi:hypothetical protein